MMRRKRRRLALAMETVETPLGALLLVADGESVLYSADFADCEDRLRRLLDRRLGSVGYVLSPGCVSTEITTALAGYFAGDLDAIRRIPLKPGGTPFQGAVWAALRASEPGNPITYAGLADRLGRPQAARAVGHANAANPFCIVVPCHRLVGSAGALTGYSGGVERKRWLLDHESCRSAA